MLAALQIEPARQVAALVTRRSNDNPDVLMITSRDTGRWVIPKGWPIKGLSPAESALQEAFEEAGVVGTACEALLGSYRYDKVLSDKGVLSCEVDVFEVRLRGLLTDWPEKGQRRRKWYSAHEAVHLVAEPELASLLRRIGATSRRH